MTATRLLRELAAAKRFADVHDIVDIAHFDVTAVTKRRAVKLVARGQPRSMRGRGLPSHFRVAHFPREYRLAEIERALSDVDQAPAVADAFEKDDRELDVGQLDHCFEPVERSQVGLVPGRNRRS